MNAKANQHYQRTHRAICEAYIRLLEEKDVKEISVTEICRVTEISRGTFYEHFTDVHDLMEKTDAAIAEGAQRRYLAALQISYRDAMLEIFRYVRENRVFYSIYLNQGKIPQFEKRFSAGDFRSSDSSLTAPPLRLSEAERYYHDELFRSGVRTLLRCWLSRDCAETPEELYAILLQQYRIYVRRAEED